MNNRPKRSEELNEIQKDPKVGEEMCGARPRTPLEGSCVRSPGHMEPHQNDQSQEWGEVFRCERKYLDYWGEVNVVCVRHSGHEGKHASLCGVVRW